jgi:hypothetical protein
VRSPVHEGFVVGVVVGGEQVGGFGVGAGEDDGRHAHGIGGEARGDQLFDGFLVGTRTLPPMWPHFFTAASWSSKCTAGGARGDHVLHQFEGVQHAAEAGFRIGHDGQEIVDEFLARRDRCRATTGSRRHA